MRSDRGPSSSLTIIAVATLLRTASEAATSSIFLAPANLKMRRVVQFVVLVQQLHQRFGRLKSRSEEASSPAAAGDRLQHPLDLFLELGRRDRRQPGTHRVGRAPQQVTQEFERKINTKPEDLGEFVIRLRARDDAGIAGVGKARAGVVCKLANDLAFAAVDDHVGHGFRQVDPARNREQVLLALGCWRSPRGRSSSSGSIAPARCRPPRFPRPAQGAG